MEHIDFVLWMVLYPIGCKIVHYLGDKINIMKKAEPYSDSVIFTSTLINTVIWVIVGIILF